MFVEAVQCLPVIDNSNIKAASHTAIIWYSIFSDLCSLMNLNCDRVVDWETIKEKCTFIFHECNNNVECMFLSHSTFSLSTIPGNAYLHQSQNGSLYNFCGGGIRSMSTCPN